MFTQEAMKRVEESLEDIDDETADVLILLFGLDGDGDPSVPDSAVEGQQRTIKDVAVSMGITEYRVVEHLEYGISTLREQCGDYLRPALPILEQATSSQDAGFGDPHDN